MPAVLVHGVPETAAVWAPLVAHLERDDVLTLQLPGFGCPRPDGFGATKEEYVAWLVDAVEQLQDDGPVDLVGHDWGGGFVLRLVSTRPDLVRSWATDAAGLGHPDFQWHDMAKLWQTPGDGEDFFAQQLAMPVEERAGVFVLFGVPHDDAVAMAAQMDETMASCILSLYRSATEVGREWGPEFQDVPKPGVVIIAADDPLGSAERNRAAAARAGAGLEVLEGVSHWWPLQDPARGAAALARTWA